MSTKERIARMLCNRKLLDCQIAAAIIDNPHCYDGDPQKKEVYRITIHHFIEKQSMSEANDEEKMGQYISPDLPSLIRCYNEEIESDKKHEIAREIALYVLHVSDCLIRLIPNQVKNTAFKIIIEYLEEMSVS